MKSIVTLATLVCTLTLSTAAHADAEAPDPDFKGIAIRGSAGTDITLGLGLGAGGSWLVPYESQTYAFEIGADVFFSRATETSNNGFNDYEETTELVIAALRGNVLFNYLPGQTSTFFIVGGGVTAVSVDWVEKSPTDTSLGTPLPNGGSKQEEDAVVTGTVWQIGIGQSIGGIELRLELPLLVLNSEVGGAAALVPTVAFSLGYRF